MLDLNTTSFEDILGRLKAYEERISEENQEEDDKGRLLYTSSEGQTCQSARPQGDHSSRGYSDGGSHEYNDSYRGRGRGGHSFDRGRGRSRYNGGINYNEGGGRGENRDASHITCYRCDKLGHFVAQCPELLLKLLEAQEADNTETQEADELMMHEIVFLNEKKVLPKKYESDSQGEDIWYLDNGASNHMTGDIRYFQSSMIKYLERYTLEMILV